MLAGREKENGVRCAGARSNVAEKNLGSKNLRPGTARPGKSERPSQAVRRHTTTHKRQNPLSKSIDVVSLNYSAQDASRLPLRLTLWSPLITL